MEGINVQVIPDILTLNIFFVKDKIDKGEFKVVYFLTHKILAEYFTKPLQSTIFNILQDITLSLKERVENSELTRDVRENIST